jgi:hypothetical protein
MHRFMYGPAGQATETPSSTPGALSTTQTVTFQGKPYVLGFGAGAVLGLAVGWLVFKK